MIFITKLNVWEYLNIKSIGMKELKNMWKQITNLEQEYRNIDVKEIKTSLCFREIKRNLNIVL